MFFKKKEIRECVQPIAKPCKTCKYLSLLEDSVFVEELSLHSSDSTRIYYCKKCAPNYDAIFNNYYGVSSIRGTDVKPGANYLKKQPKYFAVDENGKKLKQK